MGDFIETGTHRSTIIKVKIETLLKKSEMYFSYCIESKDFRMHCKIVFNFALRHDLALLQDNRLS